MNQIKLKGCVTWSSSERRSDRYGGIALTKSYANVNAGENAPDISYKPVEPFVGKHVNIRAKVLETRDSCHIGDMFRSIYPSTPKVGDLFDLGVGRIMEIQEVSDAFAQIVFCRDGREELNDWIDPNLLYRIHDQTVELIITEVP